MPNKNELEKGRFLTDTQREYLKGGHESPSASAERQLRSKTRDRTVGAILDLQLVSRTLPKRDRENLYEYESERFQLGHRFEEAPHDAWGDIGVSMAFQDITHFFYKLLRENGHDKQVMMGILERTVEKAEHDVRNNFEWKEGWTEHGRRAVDVEADFRLTTVDDVDLERAKKRFESGSELSGLEMKALVESGVAEFELTK